MTNRKDENNLSEKVSNRSEAREEKRTPLDKYKDQQFVDDIPLEDLKIETKQEKNKHKSQDTSQSEEKYKSNVDKK